MVIKTPAKLLSHAWTGTRTITSLYKVYDKRTKFIFRSYAYQPFPSRAYWVDLDSPHVSLVLFYHFGVRCNTGSRRSFFGHGFRLTCVFPEERFCPSPNQPYSPFRSFICTSNYCFSPRYSLYQCTGAFLCFNALQTIIISLFHLSIMLWKIDRVFIESNHHHPMFFFQHLNLI